MPALSAASTPGEYVAIQNQNSKIFDFKNNIFVSDDDNKAVFIRDVNTTVPDYNIYYLRAGNTNAKVVSTFATLADYKTNHPTLDINSKSVNVIFEDAAAGDLRITGTSVLDVNLHVPVLPEVTEDMFGNARVGTTFAGAHQPDMTTAAEAEQVNTNRVMRTTTGIQIELDKESLIEVYSINGKLIDRTNASGTYTRELANGAYLIRINGEPVKFIK